MPLLQRHANNRAFWRALIWEPLTAYLGAVMLFAGVVWVATARSEASVRHLGTVLLLYGLVLGGAQILDTAKRFGYAGFSASFDSWWARLKRLSKPPQSFAISGTAHVTATASCSTRLIKAAPTIEERVAELERDVEDLRTSTVSRFNTNERQIDEAKARIEQVAADAAMRLTGVETNLREQQVGSMLAVVVALASTILGTFLVGFSQDIGDGLKGFM